MPENWKTFKLEDLAKRVTVGFVGSMAQEYTEEGIPMLRSQNIKPFTLDYNNLKYISEKFHKKIIKSSLKKDDVAIVRTGNPGTACVIPEGLPVLNCSDLVIVTPDKEKIDPHFLCFYFNSVAAHYVSSELVGAVQQHFNVGSAKKMKIRLPELQEQKSIVKVLKDIQDKIALNLQMNKTLEEMAGALYKHWFVDFGPFREGKFVESELGMIPEGWEVKRIGDTVKIIGGYAFKSKDFSPSGEKVIKIKNISNNVVTIQGSDSIPRNVVEKTNSKFEVSPGKYLIAMTGAEVGKVGVVPNYGERLWLNQRVGMISEPSFEKADNLIGNLLQSEEYYEKIQNLAYGSAQPNISSSGLESIQIPLPNDKKVLKKFLNNINNWDVQKVNNYSENQTLTSLRDTLLPKLISGEVRVKEAEKILTEAL